MACVFKRRNQFWISYYINGRQIKKSLHTENERVALAKKRRIEYELALGDLHVASKLPLPVILEAFCRYMKTIKTYKSYKNDVSRLRTFFGPICDSLKICPPGAPNRSGSSKPATDKYAKVHIRAELLEDITSEVINRFLAARVEKNGWAPKTANSMRTILHSFFAYAIRHHGFIARDRRYPNPAAGVDRRSESAPQIRFLNLDEIDQQLAVVKKIPVIHAMVALYIYAGGKPSQIL